MVTAGFKDTKDNLLESSDIDAICTQASIKYSHRVPKYDAVLQGQYLY